MAALVAEAPCAHEVRSPPGGVAASISVSVTITAYPPTTAWSPSLTAQTPCGDQRPPQVS